MQEHVEQEARRPLHIFVVNETDQFLEFADPKCEYGLPGKVTPIIPIS